MEVKAEPQQKMSSESLTAGAPNNPRSRALGTIALVVVLVTPGVLTWLMSRARPALPTEMPALVLDANAAADQLRADTAQSAELPASESVEAHLEAIRASNLGELDPNDRPNLARARHNRLLDTLAQTTAAHGPGARPALRAADLERAMAALGQLGPDRDRELGGLVPALERYDMVRDGHQVAPDFVVRTVFKARWNGAHDRPLTEELSPEELRAYWGWLALEAVSAPLPRRLEAVAAYTEAGGMYGPEARGVLLMQAGQRGEAAEAFEAAWAEAPRFRVRNHALAARRE